MTVHMLYRHHSSIIQYVQYFPIFIISSTPYLQHHFDLQYAYVKETNELVSRLLQQPFFCLFVFFFFNVCTLLFYDMDDTNADDKNIDWKTLNCYFVRL